MLLIVFAAFVGATIAAAALASYFHSMSQRDQIDYYAFTMATKGFETCTFIAFAFGFLAVVAGARLLWH